MAASGDDYLPVGERPEWADVAPRPLPATPQPVASIARDGLLADLMDYFWAAVGAGELRCAALGGAGAAGQHQTPAPAKTVAQALWRGLEPPCCSRGTSGACTWLPRRAPLALAVRAPLTAPRCLVVLQRARAEAD